MGLFQNLQNRFYSTLAKRLDETAGEKISERVTNKIEERFNLKNPADWQVFFKSNIHAGVHVDITSAYSLTAVFAAVKVISETISSLPLNIYKRSGPGKEIFIDHPSYFLLHHEPSPYMTSMIFIEKMVATMLLWGNAYARIIRDGGMTPIELQYIHPSKCEPFLFEGRLFYKMQGSERLIDAMDMIHVPDLGFDGLKGISRIENCARSLGVNLATEKFSAGFYKNGAHLGGVMSTPYTNPDMEQLKGVAASFNERYSGSDKAGETAFLPKGYEYKGIGIPPEQAQFIQTKKFGIEEVARIFNLPLNKIRDYDKATFTNVEQMNIEFVTNTIRPIAKRFEQEIDRKMFKESEKGKVLSKFILEGLLRGDTQTQTLHIQTMMDRGVYSINDALELLNRNPIGEIGDTRYVQQNMQPIEKSVQNETGD